MESLPLSETISPASADEAATAVAGCFAAQTAVYPLGGGTSLDFGLPAAREGTGLSLAGMNRIVDYPARDMTITVEPGLTLEQLARTLAAERQELPVDVAAPGQATIGGLVACGWNGHRRFGTGTIRDYVIGIQATDGRGQAFKGGGRVVKNVAGYDFCKLLTGSLGTLGVITQLTLKLRPVPQRSIWMVSNIAGLDDAERMLAALVQSDTAPAAIELAGGGAWRDLAGVPSPAEDASLLLVNLEGTEREVQWMAGRLGEEWKQLGASLSANVESEAAALISKRVASFPAEDAPLVLKAGLPASGVVKFIAAAREIDPACSFLAHAGNGIVFVRFSELPAGGLSKALIARLQPLAAACGGHVIVLKNPGGGEMTRQSVWGRSAASDLMQEVKRRFDPANILNPGRFIFP